MSWFFEQSILNLVSAKRCATELLIQHPELKKFALSYIDLQLDLARALWFRA